MTLVELEAEFVRLETPGIGGSYWRDAKFNEADGVRFLCPVCFEKNRGRVGTHMVLCWRPQVPLVGTDGRAIAPGPGRWEFQGTGISDLTLVAGSSSILLLGGCNAHFFVRNGVIC